MDGGKLNCSEVEIPGALTGPEAIGKAKQLRWALRTQMENGEADALLGSLKNGSVLEVGVRPHGEAATVVKVWFVSGNRKLDWAYRERDLKNWIDRMMAALGREGWRALEER